MKEWTFLKQIINTYAEGTMMGFEADIGIFPKIENFAWTGFEHEFLVHEWV